ncbi:MAG: methylmalonyl-CoA mutase [Polaribacter sp.]
MIIKKKTPSMIPLFDNFEKQSKAEWLAKVTKDLKGKPIESLDWALTDELTFPPFAHAEDRDHNFPPIFNNKNTNSWEMGALVFVTDFKAANTEAIQLLEAGANALCFHLTRTPSKSELTALLDNIQMEWISTHFKVSQESWKQLTECFVAVIQEKGQDPKKVACSVDVAGSPISEAKELSHLREITKLLPKGHFLSVNTCNLFVKKEKIVEALAQTIHQGNQLLVALNKEGLDLKDYMHSIQFNISITDSYFVNIAALRALRILWSQVVGAWEESLDKNATIIVHLNESTQVADENYNKIKAGAQAMAAVIGGADRLYIYPSDAIENKGGSAFTQRIALNVQHLMQLESYMDRVVDPGAGSYYVEEMTERIGAGAWGRFCGMG